MNEYGDYLEELLGNNEQTKILANSELSLFEKIKELDKIGYRVVKKSTIPNVSQQRELLIAFGMDSCFDQKSEQNKKFVTARVDAYLKSNL